MASETKTLPYPETLTPTLVEILGRPNFMCSTIASAFRQSGEAEIACHAEAEQAFVLHWLTVLHLKHGEDWRQMASDKLEELLRKLREAKRPAGNTAAR